MSARSMEGLGPSPEPNYLHVDLGKTEDGRVHPWHFYDYDSNLQIPVFEQSLTGRLAEIKMKKGVFQQKEHFKIMFKIISGRTTWYIRSGVETTFTRGVILCLQKINGGLKEMPELLIHAKPGDTSVYGSVYYAATMDPVLKDWDKDVKLMPIVNEIQQHLGQEPQTIAQMRQEYDDNLRR